jgi:Cu-processing system permease protein
MRITRYVMLDILRNRILIFYTVLLAVFSWSVFSLEDNIPKGLLTLMNVVLFTVPLVSTIFSTIYIYNSSEFTELLVSQPLKRGRIWTSLACGLALSMTLAFAIGCGIPLAIYSPDTAGFTIFLMGVLISAVFVSLAVLTASLTRDKARGIGISVITWLFFALLFDGLVLFLLFQLGEYPIEKPMVIVASFNPIDLARILILLQLDASAMLGYTGAIFREFFGTSGGMAVSLLLLLSWVVMPFMISVRRFKRMDL